MTLHLDQGAAIIAADSSASTVYDAPEPNEFTQYQDFGHSHWHNSLIWGDGAIHAQYATWRRSRGPAPQRP